MADADEPAAGATAPAPAPTSRARRLARAAGKKLLALGIGVAISLLFAECALRVIGIGSPVFHRPDARYGMVLIPGESGWFVIEGKAWVSINCAGMRDVAHARAKPAGTFRIAVLGDSYTEALQVPLAQAFWSVLGAQLGTCAALAGQKVEVLNFGVSGYSTAQELLVLQDKVWAYQPDAVVLAFLTGNDVADNSPALTTAPVPFFRFEGDALVLDARRTRGLGTGARALHWMIRHSRVLQLGNQMRLNLALCGKLGKCAEDRDVTQGELGQRNGVYLEPTDDAWRDAWRVTEALLVKLRDEVAALGARFYLVTLSNGIQVHPDLAVRERFRAAIGAPDLFYADRRLAAFAEGAGIPVLTLAPRFAEAAARDQTYFHGWKGPNLGKGHWNPDGHRAAGEAISAWMCQSLAPGNPASPPAP